MKQVGLYLPNGSDDVGGEETKKEREHENKTQHRKHGNTSYCQSGQGVQMMIIVVIALPQTFRWPEADGGGDDEEDKYTGDRRALCGTFFRSARWDCTETQIIFGDIQNKYSNESVIFSSFSGKQRGMEDTCWLSMWCLRVCVPLFALTFFVCFSARTGFYVIIIKIYIR